MEINYVISIEEVLYGALLLALTMIIHGTGMMLTLRAAGGLRLALQRRDSPSVGLVVIVLASVMIIFTNLLEVMLWTWFFMIHHAQPNHSMAFYNALLNYTTLQAGYLPRRWHLLEPLLAMAGLLTMAWSTGVLFMLAQQFQDEQMQRLQRRREVRQKKLAGEHPAAAPEKR